MYRIGNKRHNTILISVLKYLFNYSLYDLKYTKCSKKKNNRNKLISAQ